MITQLRSTHTKKLKQHYTAIKFLLVLHVTMLFIMYFFVFTAVLIVGQNLGMLVIWLPCY